VTDAEGHATRTEYDALGNQARRSTLWAGAPNSTTTIGASWWHELCRRHLNRHDYDELGRRTSSTDRAGRVTQFVYDAMGRLTETIYPDATPADDTDNPRTKTEYDKAGQVTAQIDERATGPSSSTTRPGDKSGAGCVGLRNDHRVRHCGRRTSRRTLWGTSRNSSTTRWTADGNDFADATRRRSGYDALGRVVAETDQAGA